ncbi:MAG: aldo/keto reductase [Oscillospiraceae bacterium]|nr:aldo/keto reductase [Oscillospiraceae bacterium]
MDYVTLGSTGITVNKNGFGALPIQRLEAAEAGFLLKKAYDNGITFFDTARGYTDSEEKIGLALSDIRDKIIIATKTLPRDVDEFWVHLSTSLTLLKTDYIDIYQFHNPSFCPKPGDGSGLYEAMLQAKEQGKIRHIGITNHRMDVAREAVESGLYETLQFPISYLATDEEATFIRLCEAKNMGVLAMKALSGGLITNSAAAYAFMMQFPATIPIWGIQRENELDEFISYQTAPPSMDDAMRRVIERDVKELGGEFCRGCGYCLPCPANIMIPMCARMSLLIKRAPKSLWGADMWKGSMNAINDCVDCGHCKAHCPYGLDVPNLLRENLADFQKVMG